MKYTIILRMSSGKYHVACTDDVMNYERNQRSRDNGGRGFFNQKCNSGKTRVVFIVRGDYALKIHAFGAGKMVRMLKTHSIPLEVVTRLMY